MSDEENSDVELDVESTGSHETEDDPEEPLQEYVVDDDAPVETESAPPSLSMQSSLLDMHPQEVRIGMDEVLSRCTILRDERGNIKDPLHRSLPFLTKYEYTKILGVRATQIENGAAPMIPVDDTVHDAYLIAKEELLQKKTPIIIKRPIPNSIIEYWKLEDLEILM
jgi:DNA-directed RNA polymerase I, II, and III subunit RPABC2